jgi:choice-of-anchor A domain-containing protein
MKNLKKILPPLDRLKNSSRINTKLFALACGLFMNMSNAATIPATWVSTTVLMQDYSAVVLNNLTPGTSEIKGSLYVGGIIAAGNALSVNSSLMPNGSLGGSLVVGGIIQAPIQLHSGNVLVGGIVNTSFNNSGGGNITVGDTVTGAITNTNGGDITIGGQATGIINNVGGGNITVSGSITNILNNQNGGDIIVGGDIVYAYNNEGGGTATVAGYHNGGVSSPVSLPEVSLGINVQDIRTRFEILSTELSTLSSNGIIEAGNLLTPDSSGGTTVTPPSGTETPSEILVFNVDGTFFNSDAPTFSNSEITTVVNVAGANFTITDFDFDDEFENVVFNFYEAVTLDIDSTFGASILAPFADTENTSEIKGSLVTNNYINSGIVSPPVFEGDLTPWEPEPPVTVPVPASAWLFFSALLGMAIFRRGQSYS